VPDLDLLATSFEETRPHLRSVAYRMLGSHSEADDAVQEAWLRLERADTSGVANLKGWLTTVVARVCLDMLRSRKARREDPIDAPGIAPIADVIATTDPEKETLLADSLGFALLVVLDTLAPAERLAFVLHDLFGVPFEEIAQIIGRSLDATRQLASRARRRVQGAPAPGSDLGRQREVVTAFLTAMRSGDLEGLLAVLDPDVVVRSDATLAPPGAPREVRGARNWAQGAVAFGHALRKAEAMLVDGSVGIVLAPGGKVFRAVRFTFEGDKITAVEIIADPAILEQLELAVLSD